MKNYKDYNVDTSLINTSQEYVCLIDIMGTKNCMRESFQRSANFILRLHCCVTDVVSKLNAKPETEQKIKLHSIMDGVYLTCADLYVIKKAIKTIYFTLAEIFNNEKKPSQQFLIRGAIARGDISHGENITKDVCRDLAEINDEKYIEHLLFGLPMIQAYEKECAAPPFGIYIHESARSINGLQGRYFYWWSIKEGKVPDIVSNLSKALQKYFKWCANNTHALKMDYNKISGYKEITEEYFRSSSPSAELAD